MLAVIWSGVSWSLYLSGKLRYMPLELLFYCLFMLEFPPNVLLPEVLAWVWLGLGDRIEATVEALPINYYVL